MVTLAARGRRRRTPPPTKFKVPVAEQKELFAIVGTTHDDIVTRK
jgi:hypothetical protein